MNPEITVQADDFERRVIPPVDFVADTEAFIDTRLPRSAGKASYSFIGPGVSQNPDQVINLQVPHGYNVGAASMPSGVVNNQHLHYTAEVFICTRGRWRMNIGEHADQALEIEAGTIFSVPTWVFRGFENVGEDDGWMFVVLGGDETGGIIWAPDVLRRAAETGLHLRTDCSIADTRAGATLDDVVEPLEPDQLSAVDRYSDDELAQRAVRPADLQWSSRALLSSVLASYESAISPVIGYGLTQDRSHRAPIATPHGFSMEWLRIPPGSSTGTHRHNFSQTVLLTEGEWEVSVNRSDKLLRSVPAEGSIVSIPPGAWRNLSNVGETDAQAVIVCDSDHRAAIEWDSEIVAAARSAGWSIDAAGYIAPAALLARSEQ